MSGEVRTERERQRNGQELAALLWAVGLGIAVWGVVFDTDASEFIRLIGCVSGAVAFWSSALNIGKACQP